jgi:hypothetical protein
MMMDMKTILEEWERDCVIDDINLDESSRITPTLHAKYLQLLSNHKLMLRRAEFKQKELLKDKWLYYNGKMTQEEVKTRGWDPDPFDGLKIMKGEMDYYYDADPDIQRSEEKIQYYKVTIDTLTDIIDNIKWRHQTIGNMIKWRQFQSGN